MAHYEILENFTKVPNEIFIAIKFISGSGCKIYIHVVRKTIGYNKKSDGISISQFVEATGLSTSQVKRAIKELKELKILRVTSQTQKNGGKSYNRYELNLKGINTLVSKRTKGESIMNQGLGSKRTKGESIMNHTKDNRQNTIEQKKRERVTLDFLYFKFSDELQAKQTDRYLEHLVAKSGYIKSETAFKITIKKKLAKGDSEQLQDFEEWYLTDECKRLKAKYKDEQVVIGFKGIMYIENIYPYFDTKGYNKGHLIYMLLTGREDDREIKGFKSGEDLEKFIKEHKY